MYTTAERRMRAARRARITQLVGLMLSALVDVGEFFRTYVPSF
jgi:hypothetical protein